MPKVVQFQSINEAKCPLDKMYLNKMYISIAFLICLKFVVCEEKPVVDTTHGKIMGKVLKTLMDVNYYGFMGIPYAVPPVGELRFMVCKKTAM